MAVTKIWKVKDRLDITHLNTDNLHKKYNKYATSNLYKELMKDSIDYALIYKA